MEREASFIRELSMSFASSRDESKLFLLAEGYGLNVAMFLGAKLNLQLRLPLRLLAAWSELGKSYTKRRMNPAEIVMHVMKRNRMCT